jgi:hypothetical protein
MRGCEDTCGPHIITPKVTSRCSMKCSRLAFDVGALEVFAGARFGGLLDLGFDNG